MKFKQKIKSAMAKIKMFFKRLYLRIFKTDFLHPESLVNYIFTAESLPEPLDITAEQDLVRAFQDNHDLNAKSKLIEHNLRLVMYIAKRFESKKLNLEDLVSVGSIGLIKAVDSYKLDKNIKLATYASRCIENEILMHLRKINKSVNDMSLDDILAGDDEGNNLTLGETIPDPKPSYENIELESEKVFLMQCVNTLNDRERQIMCMRYGLNGFEEQTQKEVADSMNISQSYISRLEKKILNKLQHQMLNNK